jgi:hypothetical protein
MVTIPANSKSCHLRTRVDGAAVFLDLRTTAGEGVATPGFGERVTVR